MYEGKWKGQAVAVKQMHVSAEEIATVMQEARTHSLERRPLTAHVVLVAHYELVGAPQCPRCARLRHRAEPEHRDGLGAIRRSAYGTSRFLNPSRFLELN